MKKSYINSGRIDDILFAVVGRKHYYFVKDQLGSVKKILDKDNRVVNSYRYKPFGGIVAEKEGVENRYLFTGRERINQGVYYYRARVYLSELRRFGRYDPVRGNVFGYVEWNRFVYVKNQPIIYIDPYGLEEMYNSWEYSTTQTYNPIVPNVSSGPSGYDFGSVLMDPVNTYNELQNIQNDMNNSGQNVIDEESHLTVFDLLEEEWNALKDSLSSKYEMTDAQKDQLLDVGLIDNTIMPPLISTEDANKNFLDKIIEDVEKNYIQNGGVDIEDYEINIGVQYESQEGPDIYESPTDNELLNDILDFDLSSLNGGYLIIKENKKK